MQGEIDIDDFRRVRMMIGKVVEAERVKGTDRLLRLVVDFGSVRKTAVTGLGHLYEPEHFLNKKYAFVINLKPRVIRGIASECMMLAAMKDESRIVPLTVESDIDEGSEVL